jgi:CBS domain-containing protein
MLGFGSKRPIRFMDFVEEGTSAGDIATKGVVSVRENDGFHLALKLALSGYRLIPILDDKGESVRGITTSKEILDFLGAGPLSREGGKEPLDAKVKLLMKRPSIGVGAGESAKSVMESFRENKVDMHHVEKKGKLHGIITESDITYRIQGNVRLKVGDVMTRSVFFVNEDDQLANVARMLAVGPYRKLPVVTDGFLVGIITPFDVMKHLNESKRLSSVRTNVTSISDIMNRDVATIRPDADVADAVALMRRKNISGLPVTEEQTLVGIITERDIIDAMR